jgi:hypothetical protein
MILPKFREDFSLVKHLPPAVTIIHVMLANTIGNELRDFKKLSFIFPWSELLIGGFKFESGSTSRVDCFTRIGEEVMTSRFARQPINNFADSNSSFNSRISSFFFPIRLLIYYNLLRQQVVHLIQIISY